MRAQGAWETGLDVLHMSWRVAGAAPKAWALPSQLCTDCRPPPTSLLPADAQRGVGGSDDTLVINRASLLKNTARVGSASKDSSSAAAAASKEQAGLLKPRRLGVLGKAQRVVATPAGRPPLAPAAAAAEQQAAEAAGEDAAAAAEANRKRKAEMEAAQSPNPQLQLAGLGEGKRRQSPCDEVRIGRAAGSTDAVVPAAAAAKPAERQLPPVPRFDEQRSAAAASASQTAPAEVVTTAAPGRPPIPAAAASQATAGAGSIKAAAAPAGSRQQVVLQECGAATQGRRQAEQGDEEDETAPVVMSKLAQRVQRGRQSLAPSKVGRWMGRVGGVCLMAALPLLLLPACWPQVALIRGMHAQQHLPIVLPPDCRSCLAAMAACCTAAALALLGWAAMRMMTRCRWPTDQNPQQRRQMLMPHDRWRGRPPPPPTAQPRRSGHGRQAPGCRLTVQAMWL